MKARQWLRNCEEAFEASDVPDARLDARYILADVLALPLGRLFMALDTELDDAQLSRLDLQRLSRASGKPIQYVQNKAYFMGYEFFVDERVLIPRQDTELLCELAIERIVNGRKRVLDVCTGSGAVAIAIALKCPNASVFAGDISKDAIDVARENAERLGAKVGFCQGDFLDAFDISLGGFDIITCNPPYLTKSDMDGLQREVAFEPKLALYGGDDGLDFYRRALKEVPERLNTGGTALFEVGIGQAKALSSMNQSIKAYKDLNGIDRVIEFGGF